MSVVPGRDVPAVPAEWVDAVNAAINDAMHDDLCNCNGWPDACRSYKPGTWDTGVSLDIAVGVLEPLIRAKVEAELAEPTEYGRAGVQWTWGELEDGEARAHDYPIPEAQARTWASESPYGVLLRREHTAWHRWPLTEEEADGDA